MCYFNSALAIQVGRYTTLARKRSYKGRTFSKTLNMKSKQQMFTLIVIEDFWLGEDLLSHSFCPTCLVLK